MSGLRLLLVDEFGNMRTLSDNVHVGADQPTNPDVQLWVDTTTNPPTIKYRQGENYISTGASGVAYADSISNIPTHAKLVIINISGDGAFAIGDMAPGQEIHIIITGSGTITIPNDDTNVNMTEDTITVEDYAEINVISDGIKKYIRSI